MEVDPKLVNVVTGKYLLKKGIDPYKYENWAKNVSDNIQNNQSSQIENEGFNSTNKWNRGKDWSDEKNAGDGDAIDKGGYFEVENGQMVNAKDYDKYVNGRILKRFNHAGKELD